MKARAIVVGYNSHDCETRYKCPYCSYNFGFWDIFGQEPNESGTKNYCPNCKKELAGMD